MSKCICTITLIFLSVLVWGQSMKPQQIKEYYWGKNDNYKNVNDIPEKWSKESAVIIYQEYNYIYESSKKLLKYSESFRKRIKLLDASAVEEYSEFSFAEKFQVTKGYSKKGGRILAGFKVIKADGTEKEIDLKDAVEVKNNSKDKLKKIAIPNLQPGDIIDYYYFVFEPFNTFSVYTFRPIISTMNGRYPVINQRINFDLHKNFYLNFKGFNGVDQLEQVPHPDKKTTRYTVFDSNRDKFENERWLYPDRVLPLIKFQVIYAKKENMKKAAYTFIGPKGKVLDQVSDKKVWAYFDEKVNFNPAKNFSDTNAFLRRKGIKSNETEKIVMEAYAHLRYQYVVHKIEPVIFIEEGYISFLPFSFNGFPKELDFINLLGDYLLQKDIDFDVIVGIKRNLAELDELLLKAETELIIRVNTKEPIFLSLFSVFKNAGDAPHYLQGTEAYALEPSKNGFLGIEKTNIPASSSDNNKSVQKLQLLLEEDLETIQINRESYHYGQNKNTHYDDLIFIHDYLEDDYAYYEEEWYIERADLSEEKYEKIKTIVDEKDKRNRERQLEIFKVETEKELDLEIKSYDGFEIIDLGRRAHEENSSLAYLDTFKLTGVTRKAGKNVILNIGMFIGGQVALREDEMERRNSIFMDYPRSFANEIHFTIPEGYTVEGLDNIRKSVINDSGRFESSAVIDGNILKINTIKTYNNYFEPKENWENMVEFLEAAYQFTQEKILLKRVTS